jgi:CheY-like chemotaxis protein
MKKRIVIAEDHASTRELIAQVLRSDRKYGLLEKYNVFEAADGLQAWNHIEKEGLDLLITDIQMPNIDGYSLINNMQKKGCSVPIIVCAGDFKSAKVKKYSGNITYISKPAQIVGKYGIASVVAEMLGK